MVFVSQFDCKANLRGITDNLVRKNIAFVRLTYVEFEIEIRDEFSNDYLKAPDDFLRSLPTFVTAHPFCASHKAWFKCHARAGVDLDAINYVTKYTTKRMQNFPTVTKSRLMNPYLNQEQQNSSILLTTNY